MAFLWLLLYVVPLPSLIVMYCNLHVVVSIWLNFCKVLLHSFKSVVISISILCYNALLSAVLFAYDIFSYLYFAFHFLQLLTHQNHPTSVLHVVFYSLCYVAWYFFSITLLVEFVWYYHFDCVITLYLEKDVKLC